jgi:hypothetical protein
MAPIRRRSDTAVHTLLRQSGEDTLRVAFD